MAYKLSSKFYFLILLALFFYEPLNQFIGPISYIDEILGGFALFSLYRYFFRKGSIPYPIIAVFFLLLSIIILGIVSSINSGIDVTWGNRLINLYSLIKNQLVFFWLLLVPSVQEKKETLKLLGPIIKIYIVVAFIFALINIFHDIGMTYDVRFTLRSFKFIYNNPATLNDRILCGFAVLVANRGIRKNLGFILLGTIVIILTFRSNGLAALAVFWALFGLLKLGQKLTFNKILFVALIAIFTGWGSIKNYLIEDVTPRGMMLRNGIMLANRYFPLGSGLGTYGSDIAFKFYSPIYYELGYDKIWVLAPVTGSVATDNFWPMLFGQYGWISSLLFLIVLLIQFWIIMANISNSQLKAVAITLISYMIMKSMGEAVFTAVYGMLIYAFMAFTYQKK